MKTASLNQEDGRRLRKLHRQEREQRPNADVDLPESEDDRRVSEFLLRGPGTVYGLKRDILAIGAHWW